MEIQVVVTFGKLSFRLYFAIARSDNIQKFVAAATFLALLTDWHWRWLLFLVVRIDAAATRRNGAQLPWNESRQSQTVLVAIAVNGSDGREDAVLVELFAAGLLLFYGLIFLVVFFDGTLPDALQKSRRVERAVIAPVFLAGLCRAGAERNAFGIGRRALTVHSVFLHCNLTSQTRLALGS